MYYVKNASGAEFEVPESQYNELKNDKNFTCWTAKDEEPKVFPKKEKEEKQVKYPIKDEDSPWYTLSNGKRYKGKKNALKEQAKLDG